jgi:hydrogenase maturation factor
MRGEPVDCRAYIGKVLKVGKESATVETKTGKRDYIIDFAKDIKAGETVVVHRNHIVVRITDDALSKIEASNGQN